MFGFLKGLFGGASLETTLAKATKKGARSIELFGQLAADLEVAARNAYDANDGFKAEAEAVQAAAEAKVKDLEAAAFEAVVTGDRFARFAQKVRDLIS